MIYRFDTERYVFEKKECLVKASDELYAICYALTIGARDTQQQIRKTTYLVEHTPECTFFDCVSRHCSSIKDLLEMPASEYFLYINFISRNYLIDPDFELVVSAEKNDFYSIFEQSSGKKH
jgi:hypothetical protein